LRNISEYNKNKNYYFVIFAENYPPRGRGVIDFEDN
jgi:hypothetical protein